MNGTGNMEDISAEAVPPETRDWAFDREAARRSLIALRVKHGADTPIGHRCSNLVEQLQALWEVDGDTWKILRANIAKQMAKLHELTKAA